MSKRYTLTAFEVEQIVEALNTLKNETTTNYQVIKVGQRFYAQLIEKLQPSKKSPGESK